MIEWNLRGQSQQEPSRALSPEHVRDWDLLQSEALAHDCTRRGVCKQGPLPGRPQPPRALSGLPLVHAPRLPAVARPSLLLLHSDQISPQGCSVGGCGAPPAARVVLGPGPCGRDRQEDCIRPVRRLPASDFPTLRVNFSKEVLRPCSLSSSWPAASPGKHWTGGSGRSCHSSSACRCAPGHLRMCISLHP